MKKLVLKKCNNCGALIEILKDCTCDDCGIICCDREMVTLKPNDKEHSFERHMPEYIKEGDKVVIKVNHVMEDEHFIEWIKVIVDNSDVTTYLKPGEEAKIIVPYVEGMIIYSYCNIHGLWKAKVK